MPWIDSASTLVHAWLGGQETGHALADILFGDVNPSGRLSVTFPRRLQDTPAYLNFGKRDRTVVYGEGVFVGHRYYAKVDTPPQFYFGYGLSYTKFKYSNLVLPTTFGQHEQACFAEISVDVTNIGSRDGSEVVQVYVSDIKSEVQRPSRELKAFKKLQLAKGEKETCRLRLDKYALSYWSEEENQWKAEAGDFAIIISRSSDLEDEVLRGIINLQKTLLWSGL